MNFQGTYLNDKNKVSFCKFGPVAFSSMEKTIKMTIMLQDIVKTNMDVT